ncbi:MAG: hypothetical protein KDH88_11645 [Chromatiales bacterium]|nr:hypothetical protein [Chromatiales bacterium]
MDLRFVIAVLVVFAGLLRLISGDSYYESTASSGDWEVPVIQRELGQSYASAEREDTRYLLEPKGRFSLKLHITEIEDGRLQLYGEDIGLAAFIVGAYPLGGMDPLYRASFSANHEDGTPSRSMVMPASEEIYRQLNEYRSQGLEETALCLKVSGSSSLVQRVNYREEDVTELYRQTMAMFAGEYGEPERVVIFDRLEKVACGGAG